MTDKTTFEIFIFRKIPVLTNVLLVLFLISLFVFMFFYGAANNKRASPEMVALYFVKTSTILILYISTVATGLFMFLYYLAKRKQVGTIIFNPESIEIFSKNKHWVLSVIDINMVRYNDTEDKKGFPNKKFTATLATVDGKSVVLRLRELADLNLFLDKLLSLGNGKIDYYHDPWVRIDF